MTSSRLGALKPSFKTLRLYTPCLSISPRRMLTMMSGEQHLDNVEQVSSVPHRYIDIGINLTDPVFRGIYHGTRRHPDDLSAVISRAREAGVKKLLVTGSDLKNSRQALDLAKDYPGTVYTTLGIHPCSSSHFTSANTPSIITSLRELFTATVSAANESTLSPLAAYGEFGLDYDRLSLCPKEQQILSFCAQLDLALSLPKPLPLFLHSRAAHQDLLSCLHDAGRLERLTERLGGKDRLGVVHSFTGTVSEMQELIEMGFHIGINGCSLKSASNCEVISAIPLDKIMLETDGPWCEMRPSHEGWKYVKGMMEKKEENAGRGWKAVKKEKWEEGAMIKGRNEPALITRVAVVVAGIKGVSVEKVVESAWENTVRVFGLHDER